MATSSKVSLKLLIDRKRERVLFAEAGKDFIDFLFRILSLPLGSVVSLLSIEGMVGCLGKLNSSIENLNNTYMQSSSVNKNNILNPKTLSQASINAPLLLLGDSASSTTRQLYRCPSFQYKCLYVTDDPEAICPKCYCKLTKSVKYVPSATGNGAASMNSPLSVLGDSEKSSTTRGLYGCWKCYDYVADDLEAICPSCKNKLNRSLTYVPTASGNGAAARTDEGSVVKGVVTYMIMDDLQVKPMSSITLLNTFKVKDLGDLEEKIVHLSTDEGLKLLKASLQSDTVLTDLFLVKKAKHRVG